MSKLQLLQAFFSDRLTTVAVEISVAVEKAFAEYQDEIARSKEENQRLQRLLDSVFNPDATLHKADPPQLTLTVSGDEVPPEQQHCEEEWSDQEIIESILISPCVESDSDQDSPKCSRLYQTRKNSLLTIAAEPIQTNPDGEDDEISGSTSDTPLTQLKPLKIKRTRLKKGQSSYICTEGKTTNELKAPLRIHTRKRPYSCTECTATYDRPCHLEIHKRIHTGEKPYECKDCGKCFNRKNSLAMHMLTHTGEKSFCCHECGKCFGLNTRLILHMRTHTGEKPHKCPFCARCFTFPSHLSRHKKLHTGERPHQCNVCGKCYTRKEHLTDHMTSHTGAKPYSCKQCGKCYALLGNLRAHMAGHTGNKSSCRCAVCGLGVLNLSRHMQEVHTGGKQHQCQDCDFQQLTLPVSGEEVPSEQEWSDEEDTENIFIPPCVESASDQDSPQSSHLYQTGKNGKGDSLPTNATEPIKTKHDGEDYVASESTSNSQTMSKSKHTQAKKGQSPPDTETTSELNAPMRAHTDDRPYKCPVCRKGFTNKNHLKTHQRIHTGERPHWCKECGKCFNRKGDLGTHMRTHTGEKPYKCSVCGKSFRRNRLNEHMRVHTGERPYQCADCEKGFISVSDLKRHQRIHTGEKPFRCNSCGKCFSQMTTLKKHMRTVHKKVKMQSSEESPDLC